MLTQTTNNNSLHIQPLWFTSGPKVPTGNSCENTEQRSASRIPIIGCGEPSVFKQGVHGKKIMKKIVIASLCIALSLPALTSTSAQAAQKKCFRGTGFSGWAAIRGPRLTFTQMDQLKRLAIRKWQRAANAALGGGALWSKGKGKKLTLKQKSRRQAAAYAFAEQCVSRRPSSPRKTKRNTKNNCPPTDVKCLVKSKRLQFNKGIYRPKHGPYRYMR